MEPNFDLMSEMEFARTYEGLRELFLEDPIDEFIESPLFMDFTPRAAQRVALKTIFGMPLDGTALHRINIEGATEEGVFALVGKIVTEYELYEMMTDSEWDETLTEVKNRIDLIIGRRGGKTTLAAMLAIFCAIKMNWRPYLHKTPAATVAILSHSTDFSAEVLELIKELIEGSPVLRRLIDKSKKHTQTTFNLKVPFFEKRGGKSVLVYSRVTIKVGAASKKTIRGKAICALLCDEIAFWNLDEKAAEKDEDILRAARPSLMQFREHGFLFKLSSPGIKQGELYKDYTRSRIKDPDDPNKLPKNYVVFKAPSWVWNDVVLLKEFQEEYAFDPSGFDCEYRSNFVDSISNFILPEFVDLCTQRGVSFVTPEPNMRDVTYSASIDAAFKSDRFAFTLLGWDGHRIKQYVMKTWQGTRQKPVQASEVAKYIRNVLKDYRTSRVHADQFAFQPLREIFDQFGITLEEATFTNTFKKQIYFNLKKLIHNKNIDLLDNEIMLNEIKQLQVEQTTTGTVRIGHPPGGHDDAADCLAISSYMLVEKANQLGIAEGEIAGEGDVVRVDATGRALDAPTAGMLAQVMGTDFHDNSALYVRDPESGQWKRVEDEEDEDEGNDGGAEVIFT